MNTDLLPSEMVESSNVSWRLQEGQPCPSCHVPNGLVKVATQVAGGWLVAAACTACRATIPGGPTSRGVLRTAGRYGGGWVRLT
jgi:hypothetical protein